MSFNDRPVHLAELSICHRERSTEPSVIVPVWITQSSLDGLQALIRFHEGLLAAGKGMVSGSHELTMFYRTLVSSIRDAEEKAKSMKGE